MNDFSKRAGVAMIHYGATDEAEQPIKSVLALDSPPAVVLLIDNSQELKEVFAAEPRIRVVRATVNGGYSGGVNMACDLLMHAGVEYAWILSNDLTVSPGSIAHWERATQEGPNGDIDGSRVPLDDRSCWFGVGDYNDRNGAMPHSRFGRPLSQLPSGGLESTDWINGCSMLISLTAIQRRGHSDEDLILCKKELEWQIRSPRARAFVVQEALVTHRVGQSIGSSSGRLVAVFMARNGAMLGGRQNGVVRLRWWLRWAWEYLIRPLLRGQTKSVGFALVGLRSRSQSPRELLAAS